LPKLEQHSPFTHVLSPLAPIIAKIRHPCYSSWRRNLSHNSFFCCIPSVSSEKLALSRIARCELSRLRCHGHSLFLSSYLCRIKRKKNSSCSACGHHMQDLTNLLLDCPASEPLRRTVFGSTSSIFDLWSRPCGVARLLSLRGVPPHSHPSKGVGLHNHHPPENTPMKIGAQ